MAVNVHLTHFRWGNDDGTTEANYTFAAAQDTNIGAVAEGSNRLLRVGMQETGGTAASNHDFQLQRAVNGGAFANVTTTSTHVKAVAAASFADAANATQRLTGMTGTFETSAAGCSEDGLAGGAPCDIAASGNTECVFSVQFVAADLAAGDVCTFRITSPDSTITNDVVPTATIANPQTVTPGTLALSTATFAPTVTATDNKTVIPSTASLSITTYAPTVTGGSGTTVTPGTASLTTAMFAPTVTATNHQTVTPSTVALSVSTFAPTVTATQNVTVTPGTASLTITAYAPTVTGGGSYVGPTPGGGASSLRSYVDIDGQLVRVSGYEEAVRLLTELKEEEEAQKEDCKKCRILVKKYEVDLRSKPEQKKVHLEDMESKMNERADRIVALYAKILKNLDVMNDDEDVLRL